MADDQLDKVFKAEIYKDIDKRLLHSSLKKLDPTEIPQSLHSLIELAERWGENDDILREKLIKSASKDELNEIVEKLAPYEDEILDWLAGPEAQAKTFSDGYIAFTALTLVYDSALIKQEAISDVK